MKVTDKKPLRPRFAMLTKKELLMLSGGLILHLTQAKDEDRPIIVRLLEEIDTEIESRKEE